MLAGSLIAWQMLIGAGGGGHDHASHSHGAAPAPAAAALPVPSSSDTVSSQPAASASAPLRELRIEMDDTMRFSPSVLTVTAGERVRLVVVNRGKLTHELVIGTADELAHHQREMKSGSAAHHHHSDSEISVEAGQSRKVIRSFDKSGELGIACFEPGHYEAGMKGKLTVLPRS